MMEDKPAWLLAGHVGIIGHDRIMVSLYKPHHTNQGIRATDRLSVNVVDEKLLPRADYVGITSGAKTDKSGVFKWHLGEGRTPVIEDSPLVMECEVVDNYETETFDNFICKINATHVEEDCLNENGKVDYNKLKPVLFEMPTYSYLRTGRLWFYQLAWQETWRHKALWMCIAITSCRFIWRRWRSTMPRWMKAFLFRHGMSVRI